MPSKHSTSGSKPGMRQQKPIVIAVMGATGTGKSTFINLASGASLGVGNGLKSCTSDVGYSHEFVLFGRRIVLIDTPGFDDTTKSDTDILKLIALHLSSTYEEGFILSGVIYMHRISDFRVGGVSRRNFSMFRKLCGEETLRNVLIVTNMWGLVDPERGEERERELKTDDLLFKPVLDKGAEMVRHDNTLESAQTILNRLIQNHPEPLRIQRELVDEGMDISETGAGVELAAELAAVIKKHKEDLEAIQREMNEALAAKDMETKQELEEAKKEIVDRMMKVEEDRDRLSREYAEEKRRSDEEMQQIRDQLKAEAAERAQRQREFDRLQREYTESSNRSREENEKLQRRMNELQSMPRRRGGFFSQLGGAITSLLRGDF
ncbi:P-loop containing nucleoside triphosphate hydrolase protein [Cristinia sonorae]|uniref:P-loop containing nucleoside triphosphate hydrolase protein n=1 Tax=Cristinia sonorae TaxID=1940300 RepID=A0A8K0UCP1_9AGAR|nr:P-loop containing nucleoside triphosphate hydrolase protein [Cristinia sonorae]